MKAKQRRRVTTEAFSVSVDKVTLDRLESLADERYGGNVSALVTELAAEGERKAAFERAWAWYGGPEPTEAEVAKLRAEWAEGWMLARKVKSRPRPNSKKSAA